MDCWIISCVFFIDAEWHFADSAWAYDGNLMLKGYGDFDEYKDEMQHWVIYKFKSNLTCKLDNL